MIVKGSLCHKPFLLVNVYTPNWDDVDFANRLLAFLPNLKTQLILGGDFNCVIDHSLDRSSPKIITPSKMSQSFSMFMKKMDI